MPVLNETVVFSARMRVIDDDGALIAAEYQTPEMEDRTHAAGLAIASALSGTNEPRQMAILASAVSCLAEFGREKGLDSKMDIAEEQFIAAAEHVVSAWRKFDSEYKVATEDQQ